MRRKALTWIFRFDSSTNVPGQARAISSALPTTSPARSTRAARMSKARLPSRTGLSPPTGGRRAARGRNGPNEIACPSMGRVPGHPVYPKLLEGARARPPPLSGLMPVGYAAALGGAKAGPTRAGGGIGPNRELLAHRPANVLSGLLPVQR